MCYAGIVITLIGLALFVQPWPRLGIATRAEASLIAGIGIVLSVVALMFPTSESSITTRDSELDQIFPVWQFGERHMIDVDASPARLMDAVRRVSGNEIFLFRTLTWIRRGGRPSAHSILVAGNTQVPIIDVALKGGFVKLADSPDRELVIGTVISSQSPRSTHPISSKGFGSAPTGWIVAGMNFLVTPLTTNKSRVITETRVNANGAKARRAFAVYWRLIYPGSALIRQTWLRAVADRAMRRATR